MPFISEVESIYIQRFYTGWITLRNQLATPIRVMGRRVVELYDALMAGNDWEVTPYLSLKRRAGHTSFSTVNSPALLLYSWKSNTQGTIPIVDTNTDVGYIASGASTETSFFTKTTTAGRNQQSSILGIGNYLYVGNPQINFKWDGPLGQQGKTNWGIIYSSSLGPNLTGAGTNILRSGGGIAWTNPNNVTSNVSFASLTLTLAAQFSQFLAAESFGFAATASIAGIQVSFNASSTSATQVISAALIIGGTVQGTRVHTFTAASSATFYTLGGSSDLWFGGQLTAAQVNAANFGIAFFTSGQINSSVTVQINNVQVTVFQNTTPTATGTGVGSITTVNGWQYVLAYGNSLSGEISNASLPSNVAKVTSVASVGVTVTASTDTQVDQIHIFRTTDSGGGNQYFEIANSPVGNANATIQDSTADTALQVTSQAELNFGNTPPPVGLINLEWFAGRMWGSVGNLLYASTGPETISGTAPNSNWNPLYQFVIPGVIVRNARWTNGMLVFTQDTCYIVRGTDITNYTVNEFVKDFGIRSYNAIDTDGTNLYVFTSDRQFILMSASGAQDIGLPIADQLLTVDPTQCYVTVNRYGLDSIVRILDVVNDLYYDYNLNQQCWNLPGILQMPSTTAMGSIEVSPGVWRLMLCSTNVGVSTLAYRDTSNFLDLGQPYLPNAVFGSIQLSDPGTLAKFGGAGGLVLEYTNAGKLPILSVIANDLGCTPSNALTAGGYGSGGFGTGGYGGGNSQITGNFVILPNPLPWPPTLAAQPKNYRSMGYYWMSNQNQLSAFVDSIQFQINAFAENKATELIGFGIFGDLKQESAGPGQIPQLQGK